MDKLVRRIVNIAVIVLAVIATIAGLYVAIKGTDYAKESSTLDISFYISYILFFAILAMLVFFVVLQVLSSKKSIISTLVLLGIAAVITLISYALADNQLSDVALRIGVSESVYKWTGAGLNITYIVFFGVIAAFLGSAVYTKIKK
jgi:hypothetical protein